MDYLLLTGYFFKSLGHILWELTLIIFRVRNRLNSLCKWLSQWCVHFCAHLNERFFHVLHDVIQRIFWPLADERANVFLEVTILVLQLDQLILEMYKFSFRFKFGYFVLALLAKLEFKFLVFFLKSLDCVLLWMIFPY